MGDEVDLMAHLEMKRKEVAAMQEAANVAKEQALALLRLQRRVAEIDAMAHGENAPATSSAQVVSPAAVATQPNRTAAFQQDLPSSLSEEDRRRFGLDTKDDEPDSGVAAALRQAESQTQGQSQGDGTGPLASVTRALNTDADDGRQEPAELQDAQQAPRSEGGQQAPRPEGGQNTSRSVAPRWSSLSAEDRQRFGLDGSQDAAAAVYTPSAAKAQRQPFQHHPDVLWGGAGGESAGPGNTGPSMSRTIAQLEAVGATKLLADLKESERRLQTLKMRG